jgi:hypothetical protein
LLAVTLLAVTFAVENVDVLKVFALIVVAVTIPPGPVALMIGALTDAAITFWDEEAGLDIAVLYTGKIFRSSFAPRTNGFRTFESVSDHF